MTTPKTSGTWSREDQPTYRRKARAAGLGFGHRGKVSDLELQIADCYLEQINRREHGVPANATDKKSGRKRKPAPKAPAYRSVRDYLET